MPEHTFQIKTAKASDVGRVRGNNEDAVSVDRTTGLLILADGMGGYNAGEVASALAVSRTAEVVRASWGELSLDTPSQPGARHPVSELLMQALQSAHDAVHQMARSRPECAGMGTTVVAALPYGRHLAVAFVGDSRLYRWREGTLEQLTRDHSLFEQLIANGQYTREQATRHVRKNIVTRALGIDAQLQVEVLELTLQADDLLLLCSDGLSDMLDNAAIARVLAEHAEDLDALAHALIDAANARGGHDNISVVLGRIVALPKTA